MQLAPPSAYKKKNEQLTEPSLLDGLLGFSSSERDFYNVWASFACFREYVDITVLCYKDRFDPGSSFAVTLESVKT